MQPLQDTIRTTYLQRFDEMTLEYRLHFASRLYAWSNDQDAKKLLERIKPEFLPETHEQRIEALLALREELMHKDYERDVNDYARRQPFFEKYPDLLLLHNFLFRIRHWLCIYGVDERSSLYEVLPKSVIEAMLAQLQADDQAVRALSTYAINTLYLYEKLFHAEKFNRQMILKLADSYDRTNPQDVQILIYLYTHCVLGETLFYYQPITEDLPIYATMLQELDHLIDDSYDDITLDNKCEFLVCARICQFDSSLTERIEDEVAQSLTSEGFIVDTVNNVVNPRKQSFMMSEHRNVLYIMSMSDPQYEQTPIV